MSFITDLLDGLPNMDAGDVDNTMRQQIRNVIGKLNEELAFVRDLARARSEIDALEKKIAVLELSNFSLEEWQATTNTKLSEASLKAKADEADRKSLGERMTVVEAGAWQSAQSPGKGNGYDPL